LDNAPTVKATPVIIRMNIPPMSTPRLSSRLDRTVINRTAIWGMARAPIPTPRTMVEIMVQDQGLPQAGIAVQPRCPWAAKLEGTIWAMLVSA